MLSNEEIESRFGSHKATIEGPEATLPKHRDLRIEFKNFAEWLNRILPEGRYKSLVETDLERVSMWAHKSIAETAPIQLED